MGLIKSKKNTRYLKIKFSFKQEKVKSSRSTEVYKLSFKNVTRK